VDTLKILVVDDEPGMRMGVGRALRDYRFSLPDINGDVAFRVDMAETGEQALDFIAGSRPDILLLDHKLPGISGLETLDRVVDGDGDMAVIMITAYASLETAVSAIKHGAYDFLAKPFTPEELKNAVRKAAESLILARQARRLAQEKRQVRFQFISVLAHELKAPLAAIEGYLHIVRDRAAGDDAKVYDHMLDRSLIRAEYMRKMITDLLDLTRVESGQKRREFTEVDVREEAKAAIETAMPQALERGIEIALHAPAPVVISADRGEIGIILNNLISNAVKYNRDNGRVDVKVSQDAAAATISVADTGIGMTADEAERLFNDFVRIKNERTRNILGSGLGLSIVKKLATLYGGDAVVKSESDKGSVFTVTLRQAPQGEK
jgi:two-component system, sensor histidine kinase and response regulator